LCLFGLALLEQKAGHFEEAYRLGSQSLELFSQLGNDERIAWTRLLLGEIAIQKSSFADARYHLETNLDYFINLGDVNQQKYYRERLASLNDPPSGGGPS
jgi:hypothetical protein